MAYSHRQYWGKTFSFVTVVLILLTVLLVFARALLPALSISLFTVLLLALFSWLTVEVHRDSVRLVFGLGLIKKSIPVNNITSTEIMRTVWWWGWGIRLTPHGWMWNISGFDAVRLYMADGRSFIIGTDQPQQLKDVIDMQLPNAGER
ncbi:MAG: hypothetical protein MK209_05040 [Planctomycetes bacterium]|nr:hypothetical protein [Planctomycetota bacterium]